MPKARSATAEIEYEAFGPLGAETVLLINGLGSQMTRWPEAFCSLLVEQGYRAVRMDNRDTGLSTHFQPGDSYRLEDMAADCMAVLDAVNAERAHIVGVSMGGMIAQMVAIEYPQRTLSLTSIMSNTGNPDLPPPPALDVVTVAPPDPNADFDVFLAYTVNNAQRISSPGYPWPEGALEARARAEYARAFNPTGTQRQMRAIGASGDRREKLRRLNVPAVVLHGSDDPLVQVEAGRDTAANIPDAELRVIDGMGHDMPPALYPTFLAAILRAVERSRVGA
jgi:pimeloyl-ACP methyl ester carboxylesterase